MGVSKEQSNNRAASESQIQAIFFRMVLQNNDLLDDLQK